MVVRRRTESGLPRPYRREDPLLRRRGHLLDAVAGGIRAYTALLQQEEALRARLNAATSVDRPEILRQMEVVQAPQCAARASALQRAEQAIGRERLYRALYEAVAPTISIAMSPDHTAEQVRFIARGCE